MTYNYTPHISAGGFDSYVPKSPCAEQPYLQTCWQTLVTSGPLFWSTHSRNWINAAGGSAWITQVWCVTQRFSVISRGRSHSAHHCTASTLVLLIYSQLCLKSSVVVCLIARLFGKQMCKSLLELGRWTLPRPVFINIREDWARTWFR